MTQLLEKAFAEASKLPDDIQDSLATLMLEELESEQRWDQANLVHLLERARERPVERQHQQDAEHDGDQMQPDAAEPLEDRR